MRYRLSIPACVAAVLALVPTASSGCEWVWDTSMSKTDEAAFYSVTVLLEGRVEGRRPASWLGYLGLGDDSVIETIRVTDSVKGPRVGQVIEVLTDDTDCGFSEVGSTAHLSGRLTSKNQFVPMYLTKGFHNNAAAYRIARAEAEAGAAVQGGPTAYRDLAGWYLRQGDPWGADMAMSRTVPEPSLIGRILAYATGRPGLPRAMPKTDLQQGLASGDLSGYVGSGKGAAGYTIRGANWRRAVFKGGDMTAVSLRESDLSETLFYDVTLERANLSDAMAAKASFGVSRLDGSVARSIQAEGASFELASLRGADLGNAKLARANFRKADLAGANLVNADLTGADFTGAKVDCETAFTDAPPLGVVPVAGDCGGRYSESPK